MKIVYVSEFLGPHDYRFLSLGLERGFEMVLVTYRQGMETCGPESAAYDVRGLKGLKIIHNPGLSDNAPLVFLKRVGHFRSVLKDERPDVVHAGWILTSGFLAALSRFRPYLLMPWGTDIVYHSKTSVRNRMIAGYAIRHAAMITCDCELQKKVATDDFHYPAERVLVMPWAVDFRSFNRNANDPGLKRRLGMEGKRVLLMMRIFRPEYAVDVFIKALPEVISRNHDARAVILGYGPLEAELKRLADGLGLSDFIHWAGYLPQSDVVNYMNISDLYVSTSLTDGSSASLLEAMACGLPVVVSDIPGNREWVEPGVNGVVARRSDPASVAAGIDRLLKSDALRRSMTEANTRKIGEKADFCKNYRKIEDIYRSLAEEGKGPHGSR